MLLYILLSLFGTSPQARAGTITQTDSIPLTMTPWGGGLTPNGSFSLSFNLYEPNPAAGFGPLQSVTLALGGTVQSDWTLINDPGSGDADVIYTTQASITLTRPDFSTIVITVPTEPRNVTIPENDIFVDSVTASLTTTATSPPPFSDLALFTGSGTIVLPVGAFGQSAFSATGGDVVGIVDTFASATLTITYAFQDVPEPSTLLLWCVGGASLLIGRLRRRAKRGQS